MLLYYLRTFLPWLLLAVVSGWNDQAGAAAGLTAAVVLLSLDLRKGSRLDALILEASALVFMALLTALAFADPHSVLLNYGASMTIGWLALTAWGTVLAGRPFTEGVGRRNVSDEIAATDLFKSITTVIAVVWAISFTVIALVLAFVQHSAPDNTALLVAAKVAGFTVPIVFTARYPQVAQKRYIARHGIDREAVR
ncbi:hypothetical protein [Actinomadura verrucosospora]|uniref:Uncharacterized protein n=1 Tax=Actinomadura verrucosospora TaxID=46165 RepID=A0A7D4AAC4_ACTVE|nr:hypothetical protein [Actinomadura verrucosospora]QKG25407.1 hypothetical protein ACTIVE_7059 [Actinomadura verrucosospora]